MNWIYLMLQSNLNVFHFVWEHCNNRKWRLIVFVLSIYCKEEMSIAKISINEWLSLLADGT